MSVFGCLITVADALNRVICRPFLKTRAEKNYISNLAVNLSANFDGEKYIDRQISMSSMRFGIRGMDFCGCGIIAMYNVLSHLERRTDLCALIRDNERSALVFGLLGLSPHGMRRYLEKRGLSVEIIGAGDCTPKKLDGCGALIHLYFNKNFTAHYVAGIPAGDGGYHFFNSLADAKKSLPWEDYFAPSRNRHLFEWVFRVDSVRI